MRKDYLDPKKEAATPQDKEVDKALRPAKLLDFYGQDKVKENIAVFIQAAKQRSDALDHVLLHGPPGLGKTTLSHIIAEELGVDIKTTTGPVLDKPGDLAGILTNLEAHDVLFIDEIHRLNTVVEEYLYSAMEDFKINILLDSGAHARNVQLFLQPFTLVGATTRSGLLSAPMRERFSIKARLSYYDTPTLEHIVRRAARLLDTQIDAVAVHEIARRSRGTPRIANNLLRRTRDFAQIKAKGAITLEVAEVALKALDVDEHGLDDMDHRILSTIIEKFGGGPVGLSTLATACSEEAGTIEEVYEPFLIQQGYLARTPRGREATPNAYQHLGHTPPRQAFNLFDKGGSPT